MLGTVSTDNFLLDDFKLSGMDLGTSTSTDATFFYLDGGLPKV